MVAEPDKARTLWVNPADAALLMDAPIALPIEADPSMGVSRWWISEIGTNSPS